MTRWTDHDVCDAIAAGRPVASDRALANAEYFALVENGQLTEKGWALIRGRATPGRTSWWTNKFGMRKAVKR